MSGVRDLRLLEAIFAAELNLKSLLGQTLVHAVASMKKIAQLQQIMKRSWRRWRDWNIGTEIRTRAVSPSVTSARDTCGPYNSAQIGPETAATQRKFSCLSRSDWISAAKRACVSLRDA